METESEALRELGLSNEDVGGAGVPTGRGVPDPSGGRNMDQMAHGSRAIEPRYGDTRHTSGRQPGGEGVRYHKTLTCLVQCVI